jgi:hypothetical protein
MKMSQKRTKQEEERIDEAIKFAQREEVVHIEDIMQREDIV